MQGRKVLSIPGTVLCLHEGHCKEASSKHDDGSQPMSIRAYAFEGNEAKVPQGISVCDVYES